MALLSMIAKTPYQIIAQKVYKNLPYNKTTISTTNMIKEPLKQKPQLNHLCAAEPFYIHHQNANRANHTQDAIASMRKAWLIGASSACCSFWPLLE